MTKRAKKRLVILLLAVTSVVLVAVTARSIQQSSRDAEAARLKISGLEALDRGDYESALSDLSFTLIRYPDDIDTLLGFADARSRVPDENGRHLVRSLATYNRGLDLIRAADASRETLITALEGRGRIERMLGQLARLELTSTELIAIDPQNRQAVEHMLAISMSLGRVIPGSADLLVRGQQTNEEWVERMRDADSEAALRWAMELVNTNGLSLDLMLAVTGMLRSEDALAIQRMQWGEVREECTDLLDNWAGEYPEMRDAAGIVAAREALILGDSDECSRRMAQIDFSKSNDPGLILLAVSIFEALDSGPDRAMAAELLAQLQEMKDLDEETLIMLATRYWVFGRSEECLGILESGGLTESENAKVKVDATLLGMLASIENRSESIESLRSIAEDPAAGSLARERGEVVSTVFDRLNEGRLTSIEFEQQITTLNKWLGDSLLLCVLGDLATTGGLASTAVKCYTAANESVIGNSTPVTLRLISALSAVGDRVGAFEQARRLTGRNNSIQAAIVLLRAWLALEESGRTASEVDVRLGNAGDPLDLVNDIEREVEKTNVSLDSLVPLRCRAKLLRGAREEVREEINLALGQLTSEASLVGLLQVANRNRLILDDTRVDSLLSSETGPGLERSLINYRVARLMSEQGVEAATRFLGARAESDAGGFAGRKLSLLLFLNGDKDDADRAEVTDALLQFELDGFEIEEILNGVVAQGDVEGSGKIFNYLIDRFGQDSPEVALADGLLTLAFDSDNEISILKAISRIDKLVSAGLANAKLELTLARLWMREPVRNPIQAIATLIESTDREPGTIPNLLLLTKLLQEAGRPAEAESSIQRLKKFENRFTPSQLAFFVNLLGSQGDIEAMRDSACTLAAASGRIEDSIGCIRLSLQLGDTATADRLLDELAALPTRSLAVDEALAARFVRKGQVSDAIEQLRNSNSFKEEVDRQIAIATIQMGNREWAGAIQSLGAIGVDLSESGEAQLLLAICNLRAPDRDVDAARDALDRVLELQGGEAGFLRRAASIAIEDIDLRKTSKKYIMALREVEPKQAEILQLRSDLERVDGSTSGFVALIPRAEAVRDALVRIKVVWELYIEIVSRGFIAARSEGNLLEARRLAELADNLAAEYRQRFPDDYAVMSRVGRIKLMIGEPESAILVARAAMEEIRGEARLIDNVLIAQAQYRLENHTMSRRILEPFAGTIIASPDSWPRCWEMLYRSRLYTGDVEGAIEAYRAWFVSQSIPPNWGRWFDAVGSASPEIAIAATAVVPGAEDVPVLQFQSTNALSRVFVRTGDPSTLAELRRRVEGIGGSSSDPITDFRSGAARVELAACVDVHDGREEAAEWMETLPDGLLDAVSEISQLSPARRAEIEPYVLTIVITLNNALARSGEESGRWKDGSDQADRVEQFLRRADEVLEEISVDNAEILDSRAIYHLAVGNATEALALASAAAEMAPDNPAILLTLAKASLAVGERSDALEIGARARGLHQLSEVQSADLKSQIDEFLEVADGGGQATGTIMESAPGRVRSLWHESARLEAAA